jgi:histidinol-phosphate aminotransferase
MENQVPEYIRTLIPYVPGKPIEETQREFKIKKVIKLASNENPLGPSPKGMKAIQAHLKDLHRYPDGSGYRLKQALSEHLGVEPQCLILGNGSNEVIDHLVRTYCVIGDAIVTHKAAFVAYKICAQIHGVRTLEAEIGSSDLQPDLSQMLNLARKDEKVKIIFLANPNNPTGTYISTPVLKKFLKELSAIRGGNIILALDYAYWEYVFAEDLPDGLDLLKDYPNLMVLRTFSKVYGLAGVRLGYGVARPELILNLEKVRQPFNINSLALVAAEAALGDTAFVKKAKTLNLRGLKFWEKALNSIGIPFWSSQGNFILANVQKGLGLAGTEVYQACLRQGVIFRPVANYGLPHALRITVGTPEENEFAADVLDLKKGLKRKRK